MPSFPEPEPKKKINVSNCDDDTYSTYVGPPISAPSRSDGEKINVEPLDFTD